MRRHLTAVLTLTLVSAVAVAAQAQSSRGDTMEVRMRRDRSPDRTFVYSFGPDDFRFDMRRGRLGITVDLRPDVARDSIGARVSGVTPGGPADRAGVQAGDVILRLNGTRLAVTDRSTSDTVQSRPGMRLINLASRIEKDDTVRLDLRRDNRPLTLTFQAGETDMDQIVERMRLPGNGTLLREFGPGFSGAMSGPQMRVSVMTDGLGDVELIRVSPELATALGISEGVLVAEAGHDSSLGLRTGDVITAIGGRRPTSPAHAMRILSSYDAGEAVQFDVMRQRRRVTVSGRMPTRGPSQWRVRPNANFDFMPGMPAEPTMRMLEMPMELPHLMMELKSGEMRLPSLMPLEHGSERHLNPRIEIDGPGDMLPRTLIRIKGSV